MTARWCFAAPPLVLALVLIASLGAQAPPTANTFTVISRDGQQLLPYQMVGGTEMVRVADLARVFGLSVYEDELAGGLTVSYRGRSAVVTEGQPMASVQGRLISLPAAAVSSADGWLVPVDFISRALTLIYDARLQVRRPTRLVLVGDVRVPRVVAQYESDGQRAQLTFRTTPATPFTLVQEQGRLVLRFQAEALDAQVPETDGALVRGLSVEQPSTIQVQLGPRFGSYRTVEGGGDGSLRVDLFAAGADTSAAAPPPAAPDPPDAGPLLDPSVTAPGLRTIVIDPGHGGEETGARGPGGTLEKDVALGVARRLKAAIEARLGLRVLLTRDGDETVRLDERAALANNNKADLFISLHANYSLRPELTGAEVFYVSLGEYGEEVQRMAASEPQTLPVYGGGSRTIEVVAWDLAQARHIERSASLAHIVQEELRTAGIPLSPRAVERAPLRVLVGANMPAVLVELGFVSNPEQERALASDEFQQNAAQALFNTITRFRSVVESGAAASRASGGGSAVSSGNGP